MMAIIDKLKRLRILFSFDNTTQLLFNRLFWPTHGPLVYKLGHLEIFIDHSTGDQDGTRSCLVPGLYAPCFTALPDLPTSLAVLDLGANGGGFLLSLLNKGYDIRRGVAVELNPHTWTRLSLNIYRNFPSAHERISLLNGAAGSSDGMLEIKLGRGSVGDSIAGDSEGTPYHLPQFSFGTLLSKFDKAEEIDLCKIDIEGAEYDLVRSVTRNQLRRCRHIIIEIHDIKGESVEDLKKLIRSYDFQEVIPLTRLVEDNVFVFSRFPQATSSL